MLGWVWLDSVMSIVGMSVITNWLWDLFAPAEPHARHENLRWARGENRAVPWKASATIVCPIFMSGASVPDIVPLSYQWCLINRSRT